MASPSKAQAKAGGSSAAAAPAPGTSTAAPPAPPAATGKPELKFGPDPQKVQCPQCGKTVTTQTTYTVGLCTWLTCLVIWCFGFCSDCTKDVEHRCPSCGGFIGRWNRFNSMIGA